jgi:hypothetical protein
MFDSKRVFNTSRKSLHDCGESAFASEGVILSSHLRVNLGTLLYKKKDFHGKEAEWKAAIGIDPNDSLSHVSKYLRVVRSPLPQRVSNFLGTRLLSFTFVLVIICARCVSFFY